MMKSVRHDRIVSEVIQNGSMTIPDLARLLEISEVTIRRDLDELDSAGVVERVRGGARRPSPGGPEPPIVMRESLQVEEKQAIGRAAALLVQDGDTVAIVSGTTPQEAARAIAARSWRSLIVVTNGLSIAQELVRVPGVQVVLIGGTLNPDELGTFGVLAIDTVKSMRLHRLLLGCRGVDASVGTSNDLGADPEVSLVRALAQVAGQVVVMADHSKLGNTYLLPALTPDDIDVLVTDAQVPAPLLERFRKQDIQVVVVEPARNGPSDERPAIPARPERFEYVRPSGA